MIHTARGASIDAPLPQGSYQLELIGSGPTVRYLAEIERGGAWDATPPGEANPIAIPIPPAEALGPDDLYVPPGWFWSGGDHLAADSLSRRRLWLDGFVIHRDAVTEQKYCDFLNDLRSLGRSNEAREREPTAGASREQGLGTLELVDGIYRPKPGHEALPVCLVSWHDACAYAAWWATRTGLPWRLPHDQEWEKAARGVDGRPWPWGHHLEGDRACMLGSTTPPARARVDAFPVDESPYGVRGMAGGVRDWCLNGYDRAGPRPDSRLDPRADVEGPRMTRGGAWGAMPALCRLAGRFAAPPDARLLGVGFRLARSWP
ncbi:MAG: SUMF1/EgtB/PvdO family nonheme iron enzyme [bacterium]